MLQIRPVSDLRNKFYIKYLTYLPTKEQLKAEIERQKEIISMQHPVLQMNKQEIDEF